MFVQRVEAFSAINSLSTFFNPCVVALDLNNIMNQNDGRFSFPIVTLGPTVITILLTMKH